MKELFLKEMYLEIYLFICKTKRASRLPIFRTNKTLLIFVLLTAVIGKVISSGKSKIARAPIARIGIRNFSRSVATKISCS
jgi:hypothetical protein